MNINGINAGTRIRMLNDYCHTHDIDMLLLQEVTHDRFDEIVHRNVYINVGTETRGTTIITKENIQLNDIIRLPSERGIAGWWGDLYIINIYAPSGTGKKERDEFYIRELPHLLQKVPHEYIVVGDFNCVIQNSDCTGPPTISRPLEAFITRCKLRDVWDNKHNPKGYTHYTAHGASRIDRIYLSKKLYSRKIATTTIIAAFTDHNAVQVKKINSTRHYEDQIHGN